MLHTKIAKTVISEETISLVIDTNSNHDFKIEINSITNDVIFSNQPNEIKIPLNLFQKIDFKSSLVELFLDKDSAIPELLNPIVLN